MSFLISEWAASDNGGHMDRNYIFMLCDCDIWTKVTVIACPSVPFTKVIACVYRVLAHFITSALKKTLGSTVKLGSLSLFKIANTRFQWTAARIPLQGMVRYLVPSVTSRNTARARVVCCSSGRVNVRIGKRSKDFLETLQAQGSHHSCRRHSY